MLIKGMSTFQTLFQDVKGPDKRPPLLRIRADFNPPDVVVGALQSVFKLISKVLENILYSARNFVRWMTAPAAPCRSRRRRRRTTSGSS
jgi:hypothetical protein